MVAALLVDLDGVIREWPSEDPRGRIPGLDEAIVRAALFEPDLLHRAVTGQITDEQWQLEAAAILQEQEGVDCAAALTEARTYPGRVRPDVLDVCRRARKRVPLCLLTNATTRLSDHLEQLSLTTEFDRVFNSCELGLAKPDVEVFRRVCDDLGAEPSDIVYVDDTQRHVDAAQSVGLRAHLFTTTEELEALLRSESVLI